MNQHSDRELGHKYNLVSSDDLDDLADEAQDYYLTPKSEFPTLEEGGRIDEYWLKVFQLQTGFGKLRFSLLGDVMKPLMSIPNSNADSERVFSMLRKIHTEFRSNLDNDTI